MRSKITSYVLLRQLLQNIPANDACMEWPRFINPRGYGVIHNATTTKSEYVHRLAWEIANGPIPDGLCVLHNCPTGDNSKCFRPSHLFLGTRPDNVEDCINKGRFREPPKGELNPSVKLTAAQVLEIRRLRADGIPMKIVASRFNVSVVLIAKITARKVWKHI